MTIDFLRTPDHAFKDLPDYDFKANYIEGLPGYEGLRGHYLDEGPKDSEHTFLCLHGQPAWSYLYRKMIPVFVKSGARVVAPDFFGFGKSDKPTDEATYNFNFHRDYLKAFIEKLDLKNVTLVCQDWGGLIGLTLPVEYPDRFKRLIIMNTFIFQGEHVNEGFANWREYANSQQDLNISKLMLRSSSILTESEALAYDAPFPDQTYKSGVRRFPQLGMTTPEMQGVDISKKAVQFFKHDWKGPCFMAVGAADPVFGLPIMEKLKSMIPGTSDLMVIKEGGHFVQEWGDEIAQAALEYFE